MDLLASAMLSLSAVAGAAAIGKNTWEISNDAAG